MDIKGLHHAQITIPKGAEEEGRKFYCGVLGLLEIEKPEILQGRGGFWLQVGDRQVHVGVEDGVERQASKAHLAYQVEDVAAWQSYLEQHGITVLESVSIPGFARFEARDPFGNRFECIEQLEQNIVGGKKERREEGRSLMMEPRKRIKVFYSYAHADREWLERLSSHLDVFKQQGRLTEWDNSAIQPGTEWSKEIDHQLSTSDLILLLLSDHYLSSQFCSTVEMPRAIEIHEKGRARTIPILLSPISRMPAPLEKLHALPGNGIPMTQWSKREEALTSIAEEIGQIVNGMRT